MSVHIPTKYYPLFELLNSEHKAIDTVILTGGRGSGKSFAVALFSLLGVHDFDYKIIYSRFTKASVEDSIRAEVAEKLELLNYQNRLIVKNNAIEKPNSEAKISFKGIKIGSGLQTANLKSLQGFNVFIIDEAEEIPDFKTFEKVYLSIRSNDKRNLSILILNPQTKDHWVYRKWYKDKVPDGFNGIMNNVMYIHTSFLDILEIDNEALPNNIIDYYEQMKIEAPQNYNHIVLGGWVTEIDGALFPKSQLNYFDSEINKENATAIVGAIDPAGGGEDSTALVIGYLIDGLIYIDEVVHERADTSTSIPICADVINRHNPNYVWIESNAGLGMYTSAIQENINESIYLLEKWNSTKKHTRLISSAGFIKKKFVFRKNNLDEYYQSFMNEVQNYSKIEKNNKHDDAPDCLQLLAENVRELYLDEFSK